MSSISTDPNQDEWARWKHLLYISELIEGLNQGPSDIPKMIALFESLEECAFPKSVDPVEEPHAYAVRQFIKALKNALEYSAI